MKSTGDSVRNPQVLREAGFGVRVVAADPPARGI